MSGGEPTIFKPLCASLKLSQQLGVNFGFTTNALAMTKENTKRLISYDPFNINISPESVDSQVKEHLRPMNDGAARIADDSSAFWQRRRHSRELSAFVGRAGDLKTLRVVLDELIALQKEGYPIGANERVSNGFMDYFAAPPDSDSYKHLELSSQMRNCDVGLCSMGIFPNGDVHFCDFLKQPIGSSHKDSLRNIYFGNVARRQRQHMIHCTIDCQQSCKRPTPLLVKAKWFLKMG